MSVAKIAPMIEEALKKASVKREQIDFIELVGGTTRIPMIQRIVGKIFPKIEFSRTLNADECVAKGCTWHAAMAHPTLRVRQFKSEEAFPYAIDVSYETPTGELRDELYKPHSIIPSTKMLTFFRSEPFTVYATYNESSGLPEEERPVGLFKICEVIPKPGGENSKVQVKLRLDESGYFHVLKAHIVEEYIEEVPEEPPKAMDVDKEAKPSPTPKATPPPTGQEPKGTSEGTEAGAEKPDSPTLQQEAEKMDTDDKPTEEKAPEAEKEEEKPKMKKKRRIRNRDLRVEVVSSWKIDKSMLDLYSKEEAEMYAQDQDFIERTDCRNKLESYVYDIRNDISSYGRYAEFVEESEREKFVKVLNDMEDWIYGDGEDVAVDVYREKLTKLRASGEPISLRYSEFHERPVAVSEAEHAMHDLGSWVVDKSPKYEHIGEEDRNKVSKEVSVMREWLEKRLVKQRGEPKYGDLVVLSADIRKKTAALLAKANPIRSKAKPKPKPKKEEKKEKAKEETPEKKEKQQTGDDSEAAKKVSTEEGQQDVEMKDENEAAEKAPQDAEMHAGDEEPDGQEAASMEVDS